MAFSCSLYFTFRSPETLPKFDLLPYLLIASLGLVPARVRSCATSPRAFQRSKILRRLNSGRPRVQQAAGRMKLRNGLAGCRMQFCTSEAKCFVHLHAWYPSATASLSDHPAPTKSLSSMEDLAAAAFQFEEHFATMASRSSFSGGLRRLLIAV